MLTDAEKSELCLKCLTCCKYFFIRTRVIELTPEGIEWHKLRGITFQKHPVDGTLRMAIPLPCPHLTSKGCDIYEKRPERCRRYDGRLDPFMKDICLWVKAEREKMKENNVNL